MRVIVEDSAYGGQDGARARPPVMRIVAGLLLRDPLAFPVDQCGFAVEACGDLQARPWPSTRDARDETFVEVHCFALHRAAINLGATLPQIRNALPCSTRIRIKHRSNHRFDAGRNQGLIARRRAPMMMTRLQRYIGGCAVRAFSGAFQRTDFCMRTARMLMPPFADDHAVAHDYAADARVRCGRVQAELSKFKCPCHEFEVDCIDHGVAGAVTCSWPMASALL